MAKKLKQASSNNGILSPNTMAFLGLSQQPFANNILSADAIFSHAALTQLKDTIKHHLQFSDLLLIVEGNFGSGKTTFFRQLMQDEIANVFLMPIQAEATDTLSQIQQKMSIHLKEQGDANYLDDNLKNLQVFDQTPVLMIDDAHVLSDTTLQEIVRYREQLQSEKELPLKILLLANKGMAATLEQITDLQHSQFFVQEVPPLKAKQIQSFISHRLVSAGAQQPPLIDDKQILAIYKKSSGIPLATMQQAALALEKLGKKSKRSAGLPLPGRPALLFGLLIAIAAVAIAVYFLPLTDTAPQPPAPSAAVTPPAPAPQPSTRIPATQPLPVEPGAAAQQTSEPKIPPIPEATPGAELADAPEVLEPAPGLPQAPNATGMEAPAKIQEPAQAPNQIPGDITPSPPAAKQAPEPLIVTPADKAAVKPAPLPAPAAPVTTDRKAPLHPALRSLVDMGIRDKDWLLEQDPAHWTLQILGAREPETLLKFARKQNLGASTAWYQTDLKGKPWYVLVHRFYTDRDVARQSIERLPDGLRQARPWVRSLASVHKSLAE